MNTQRLLRTLVLALALLASACSSAPADVVATSPQPAPAKADSRPAEPPAPTTTADEVAAAPSAIDLLESAIIVEADQGVVITTASAQSLKIPLVGMNNSSEIDPDRPMSVATILPNGSVHTFVDMGPILGAFAGGDPALAAAYDSTTLETWLVDGLLVVDSNGYSEIAALSAPDALGPFNPGVWTVDSTTFDSPAQLTELLIGSKTPDPSEVAEELPRIIANSTVSSDGLTITGTANFVELTEVLGGDIELTARGAGAGLAQTYGIPLDDITNFYVDFYRTVTADVTVVLPSEPGGELSVQLDADLSGIFAAIFDESGAFASFIGDGAEAASAQFEGSEVGITTLATFTTVDNPQIPPAPEPTEDRTAELLAFLELD